MLEELRLRNFEGFDSASVKFTEGLNLITGRNSVGKTSILDSIAYGLYGAVPGIEQRLLPSRRQGARDMEVYLRFRSPKNGGRVEVYRLAELRRGRFTTLEARLVVDGEEVQVEGLEDLRRRVSRLIGVGYRSFIWILYVRQGRLTEILEPRREELDAVLGISLLRELGEQLDAARRILSRLDGADVETEHRTLLLQVIPMEEERLRELDEELKDASEELDRLRAEVEAAESPPRR